jgi:hypothetical protein
VKILGITWDKSVLVSFDPIAGVILEKHAWLPPTENFVGLAYDSYRNMLYALAQVSFRLYSIHPLTRDVTLIGALNVAGNDVSGLTYDPIADTLYTLVHVPTITHVRTDLVRVNSQNAQVSVVGQIGNGLGQSLCWRESDGQLNSYVVSAAGSWESPAKASLVTIDPTTAATVSIFQTPYHTILGLARIPGKDGYISWINWTTHFYGDVDTSTQTITPRGASDAVRVESGAMLLRSFYVAPAPNLPPCSFGDVDCLGRSDD